jgi:uncharacterized membrane protein YGL010W
MKTLTDHLAQYAAYHRDPRNIATHFVGIPMIVLAIQVLLARVVWVAQPLPLGLAELVTALALLFYLRLDVRLGLLMAALLALGLWAAHALAALPQGAWLAWGVGLFVLGWVIQFIGHFWEGRKPAFVDDLVGLLVGPLFVATEAVFALGGRRALHQAIVARAGPVRRRAGAATVA